MTKCIVLGGDPKDVKKKPIELLKMIGSIPENGKIQINQPSNNVSIWDNVELVCRKRGRYDLDIMFAYDDHNRDMGCLYLGHWNDGVVE